MNEFINLRISYSQRHCSLEKIIPEIVSGEEGSKGIQYSLLTSLLTKVVQEQQKTIQDLTKRIEELEKGRK